MTQQQVNELAKQAGLAIGVWTEETKRFATLVRNAALEEARKATVPHSCVISAARAIESLTYNTP